MKTIQIKNHKEEKPNESKFFTKIDFDSFLKNKSNLCLIKSNKFIHISISRQLKTDFFGFVLYMKTKGKKSTFQNHTDHKQTDRQSEHVHKTNCDFSIHQVNECVRR